MPPLLDGLPPEVIQEITQPACCLPFLGAFTAGMNNILAACFLCCSACHPCHILCVQPNDPCMCLAQQVNSINSTRSLFCNISYGFGFHPLQCPAAHLGHCIQDWLFV